MEQKFACEYGGREQVIKDDVSKGCSNQGSCIHRGLTCLGWIYLFKSLAYICSLKP